MKKNNNSWVIIAAAAALIIVGTYFWRKGGQSNCQEICFSTTGERDCSIVCSNEATPAEREAAEAAAQQNQAAAAELPA